MLHNGRSHRRGLALAERIQQIAGKLRAALGSDRRENRRDCCVVHADGDQLPGRGNAGRIGLLGVGERSQAESS